MPLRVLVVYYTQTGQLHDIMQSVIAPFKAADNIELVLEEVRPKVHFPFPWTSDSFFQTMPESVTGIACELEPLTVRGDEQFDLILIGWQPWYLSPSIPAHAIFQHDAIRKLMRGKPVISVIGCRNMWVMAHEQVKEYIRQADGRLVGNIMLDDDVPNLLGVVSVIHWMFHGKQERYMRIFPPSGVPEKKIREASRFGTIILDALKNGTWDPLRTDLVNAGAVPVKTQLAMIEKRGKMLFRIWARFILKKGPYGSKSRLFRIRMFKYYLLAVLYLVSPFASVLYYVIRPFRRRTIKKQISFYQS
jgi:hypothetical protein